VPRWPERHSAPAAAFEAAFCAARRAFFHSPTAIEVLGKTRPTGLKPDFMGMAGWVVEIFAATGGQFREAATGAPLEYEGDVT
jgi:hypothetical protein